MITSGSSSSQELRRPRISSAPHAARRTGSVCALQVGRAVHLGVVRAATGLRIVGTGAKHARLAVWFDRSSRNGFRCPRLGGAARHIVYLGRLLTIRSPRARLPLAAVHARLLPFAHRDGLVRGRERSLNEEIDKAVEWGSPKGVARRAWIQVKQMIKDVYESLPLPPLKKR